MTLTAVQPFVTLFAIAFYFFLGVFLPVALAAQYGQVRKS